MKKTAVFILCIVSALALATVYLCTCVPSAQNIIIFDSDVGTDDAVSFLMWTLNDRIQPDYIIATHGNATAFGACQNALVLKTYLGMNGQLVQGLPAPENENSDEKNTFHGQDGLADIRSQMWDDLKLTEDSLSRDFISMDELESRISKGARITYIAVGPVTNLAKLLENEKIRDSIEHVYLMGGGIREFNCSHDTEFNFSKNPQAVKTVLESGLDISLFPLDLTNRQQVDEGEIARLSRSGKYPEFIEFLKYNLKANIEYNALPAAIMHDSMPVLYLTEPEKFTMTDLKITCDRWGHLEEAQDGYTVHAAMEAEDGLLLSSLESLFDV